MVAAEQQTLQKLQDERVLLWNLGKILIKRHKAFDLSHFNYCLIHESVLVERFTDFQHLLPRHFIRIPL